MDRLKALTAAFTALGLALTAPDAAAAQQAGRGRGAHGTHAPPERSTEAPGIVLRVDGMSCPFCAYGLEKRLRELPEVSAVEIRISDGVVRISTKPGHSLGDAALEDAVRKAGFSVREIRRIEG